MNLSRITLPLSLALAVATGAQTVKTLRWAVLGGSVANANTTSGYPARVGVRLPADSVVNFAFSGGTVLKSGDSSFWTSGKLAQVIAFQPDIVSIQLGANDSKPVNWGDSANFEKDYKTLIDTLSSLASKPRILVVYPTPVWKNETGTQSPNLLRGSVIGGSIVPLVRKIAQDKGADTVDLYTPLLSRQTLFTDSINPTAAGSDTLGRRIFNSLLDQSIRIVCVGNSITYAVNTNGTIAAKETYSMHLNMLLGKRYWVWNGGKTGWWMQRAPLPGASSAYKSYVTDKTQMDSVFLLKPHFITVMLGTNDARQNFWNTARYVTDYRYFIDTIYNNMTPKPKFVLFKPLPAWKISGNWPFVNSGYTADANGINGDIIRDSVWSTIDTIAASRPAAVKQVVDLYTPMLPYGPGTTLNLVSDGVHPVRVGQDTLSRILYRALVAGGVVTGGATALRPAASAPLKPVPQARRLIRTAGAEGRLGEAANSVDGKAFPENSAPAAGVYLVKPKAKPAAEKDPKR